MAKIISPQEAVKILQNEGIVAIPTETVYGLAAVASSPSAVKKVYQAKNRPSNNPLICHFYSLEQIQKYVLEVPEYVSILIQVLGPGPISYLLNLPANSPLKAATCGLDSVICRIPNHLIALEILRQLDQPLAAPSANTSCKFSATNAQMVQADLGARIDGIVDGGPCAVGLESTILDCRQSEKVSILRPGAIGETEIREIFQQNNLGIKIENSTQSKNVTPGSKYRHYAPKTPIFAIKISEAATLPASSLVIASSEVLKTVLEQNQHLTGLNLGESLSQISQNLYQKLFELDQLKLPKAFLIRENYGHSSLSLALQNRLAKILVSQSKEN